jgi:hypothetical protein
LAVQLDTTGSVPSGTFLMLTPSRLGTSLATPRSRSVDKAGSVLAVEGRVERGEEFFA